MTTKPKARKFRIKRGSSAEMFRSKAAASESAQAGAVARPEASDAPASAPETVQRTAPVAKPVSPPPSPPERPERPAASTPAATTSEPAASEPEAGPEGSTDLDAIKREGLTGRQLRMARRVAQKNNLPATSDFDAVRLLRERGIDPFARSNMLELVVPKGSDPDTGQDPVQLPQTIPSRRETLPSPELSPTQRREQEIGAIQRDIMLRRRRKMLLLLARLAFFVLLPTFVAGWYFYRVATPMYSTHSEFLILQADNMGGTGMGGLLSGTQFATSQDSIATQSFLQSKDAMLRLDRDVGFKSHFAQDWIDPIQRLGPDASNEEAYETYRKNVQIGYDPTEGVIRMEVIAADPAIASEYSRRLISYAEERVNHLSEQKRGDQMRDALQGFELAQQERRNAQEALVTLQQRGAVLDPEGVIAALRSQITNVETQLLEKQLQLAALEDNARPNQARVDGVRGDIERLESLLTDLNNRMVDASKGENSLAELNVRIQMAQADLSTRDLMLQSALQQVEQTRMEANRQVRYLTTSVEPVQSQEPSYPRKFENTILAFLIFSGIYLMLSLTASILREQVTS
ncbi:capsule biosynthesis protein [Pseudooceanicola lipolyticus]|uniref:Capsule biosynthesis protein n=1 Tax=Pseudooceanicola lipolyticus TaxID=2029104 RepID=A0A2M8J099_9RHOB|nr:capsule biosynthesis protein [Pseudooceanicola lipolyticus]PJE36184.1 capsule biosynthesis protein [Pseudooceanicola lipolyticus]